MRKPPTALEGCAHAFTQTNRSYIYAMYCTYEEPVYSIIEGSRFEWFYHRKASELLWLGYFPILQITDTSLTGMFKLICISLCRERFFLSDHIRFARLCIKCILIEMLHHLFSYQFDGIINGK